MALVLRASFPSPEHHGAWDIFTPLRGLWALCPALSSAERNNPVDTKISQEGGGGGAPGTAAWDSPAAHGEDHGEEGSSYSPWKTMLELIAMQQPVEDPTLEQEAALHPFPFPLLHFLEQCGAWPYRLWGPLCTESSTS